MMRMEAGGKEEEREKEKKENEGRKANARGVSVTKCTG